MRVSAVCTPKKNFWGAIRPRPLTPPSTTPISRVEGLSLYDRVQGATESIHIWPSYAQWRRPTCCSRMCIFSENSPSPVIMYPLWRVAERQPRVRFLFRKLPRVQPEPVYRSRQCRQSGLVPFRRGDGVKWPETRFLKIFPTPKRPTSHDSISFKFRQSIPPRGLLRFPKKT